MPTEAVRPPVTSATPARSCSANAVTVATSRSGSSGGLEVDERLVQRQRLDQRRDLAQQRHHQRAGLAVGVEPAAQERRVRAARPGLAGRHGRADAVLARLVGRGRHHPAAADAADHDRLAAQRGLVALLDRREEGVEVQVEDRRVVAHGRNVPSRHADGPVGETSTAGPAPGARPQAGPGGRSCRTRWGASLAMTSSAHRATTLTARTPEDVLAAVPVVLGFEPCDSVVMLTFGGVETFHARVDLPPPREVGEMVRLLLDPALQHRVTQVVFVVYADDGTAVRAVARRLRAGLRRGRDRRRRGAARPRGAVVRAGSARRARRRGALRRRRPPVPGPGGGRGDRGARLPRGAGGDAPAAARGRRRDRAGGAPGVAQLAGRGRRPGRPPSRRGPVHHRRAGPGAARPARPRRPRRRLGDDHPRDWPPSTSGSGPTSCSVPPTSWWPRPAAVLGPGRLAVGPRRPGLVRGRPVPGGGPGQLPGRAGRRRPHPRRAPVRVVPVWRPGERRPARSGGHGYCCPWTPGPSASRRSCWSSTRARPP